MKLKLFSNKADIIGISSAVLCLIHCLLTPFLVLFFHEYQHTHAHWLRLDYLFLLVGLFAVYHAVKHGVSPKIKAALWSSLGVLSVAIVLHEHIHWMTYVAYTASFALISTHLVNLFQTPNDKKQTNSPSISPKLPTANNLYNLTKHSFQQKKVAVLPIAQESDVGA